MLTTIEKVLLLHEVKIFSLAATEQLGRLAAVCRERRLRQGETLFSEGEHCNALFILVEGEMRLEKGGRQAQITAGSSLDPWAFFSRGRHGLTAEAGEECLLFEMSEEDVSDILVAEPELCLALLRFLAGEQCNGPLSPAEGKTTDHEAKTVE